MRIPSNFIFNLQIFKKVCKKYWPHIDIHFAIRKQHTLKSVFLTVIKRRGVDRYNQKLVYLLPYANCKNVYIGKTGRNRDITMKEHQVSIRKHKSSSVLTKHMETEKHTFDFNNVWTLSRETNWSWRIIKESILIHETFGKVLNETKYALKVFG